MKNTAGTVGVIVARFQTPFLHDAHRSLVEEVSKRHRRVLILLGSTPGVRVTRNNPLDFQTRAWMVQDVFPDALLLPVLDMPDDADWSRSVDERIAEAFGDGSVEAVLYGSRDSFVPHYTGRHPTVALESARNISGSELREAVSDQVKRSAEFRCGVIYAAHQRHKAAHPAVDIAVVKDFSGCAEVVLARKRSDPRGRWRFPGGFFDPVRDDSYEAAALREATEELPGLTVNRELRYLGSHRVQDWRYQREADRIVTALFVTDYLWGGVKAGDDIDEARWFRLADMQDFLIEQHKPLGTLLLKNAPTKVSTDTPRS